jgi:hypothetical protein
MPDTSILIKNYTRYNQKIVELINEYEKEKDWIKKFKIQISLHDQAKKLMYSFLSIYQHSLSKESIGIESMAALAKELQEEHTIKEDDPLLYLIKIELEKLEKTKRQKEYEKNMKEEYNKKISYYSKKELDELKKELYINYHDHIIIKRVMQNKKSIIGFDKFHQETDEFRLYCQKETTENLQKLITNEETTVNEKIIIRIELKNRYGLN